MIKKLGVIFSCILILFLIVVFQLFFPGSFQKGNKVITIKSGAFIDTIADQLKKEKLIRNEQVFKVYVKLFGYDRKLRAGSFLVNRSVSLVTISHILSQENGAAVLDRVTIPEGFQLTQIGKRLAIKGLCNYEEFMTFISKSAKQKFINKYTFLNQNPTSSLEGYLFPDTYFFAKNTSLELIIDTMLAQFERKVVPLYEQAVKNEQSKAKKYNLHQVLTMASIIQKESRHIEEMPLISSVFYNRLAKPMPLAADPTVVYALGLERKDIVYYKDLEVKSPFNTYKNFGLPPTPIAMAGKDAIVAALYPKKSNYLFFVANPDGTHHFTRTYKEHIAYQR